MLLLLVASGCLIIAFCLFRYFLKLSMASFNISSPSSSSSTPTGGWIYDVFLSFRGEDTRYNFLDHLYGALHQAGITAFKDDKALQRGKVITDELKKAIEESRFAVIVFSENYADSSWCLEELAEIMEHSKKGRWVLPVFYHVDPSDVRKQKSNFGTVFRQQEYKFREEMDKVNKWRKALTAAANLSGHPVNILKKDKDSEHAIIKKIVQEILHKIQPLGIEKNLIGIESHIDQLNSKLDIEGTQEVSMVGILGSGGIGKTTIARALFRRISHKFDGSSFVKGVREKSKKHICDLQKKILKDVTYQEFKIEDEEDGAEKIQTRLCNKKVLLVLDDVDKLKQLTFLAAARGWFGAGSRIIITSRDRRVLLDAHDIYETCPLAKEQALELFSRHAFRKNRPSKGYDEELSDRAVSYSHGHPLALKVIGSHFYGREAGVWESALSRLAQTQHDEIFESLKISFDGLHVSERKIFLDIAYFFKGYKKEHVTRVLDCCGFHAVFGISVLIEKSLITVSNKRLDMHDLIQDMGLRIVRESFPNSRLWQDKDSFDFNMTNRRLEAIEAIVDSRSKYVDEQKYDACGPSPPVSSSADVFGKMENLRLLEVDGKFTCSKPTILPDELRWFCWNHYPFSSLPVANMSKLVGLKISFGFIQHLWMGQKNMECLKFISLRRLSCLKRFPDISGAPNVESLRLLDCENLVEVHESLGSHRRLVSLELIGCSKLEKFPEVSSCMVKLSYMNLDGCIKLKNIPRSFCELKSLKILGLDNCVELQKLPKELGRMEKLEELRLGIRIREFWGGLELELESINFHTLTNLCSLRKLDLSWRPIEDFPNNLHSFSSLEELHLTGNAKLIELSISGLSCLKHLELNDCRQLKIIHTLPPGIQILKAIDCRALEEMEDLTEQYVSLHKIWFPGCDKLVKNEDSERFPGKMLQESFIKKYAAADCQLSIAIYGMTIPSWFKEQQEGDQITLKLPPKCDTSIMGFAVCGVFQVSWLWTQSPAWISFEITNNGKRVSESKVEYRVKDSAIGVAGDLWIVYIPFSFFQQQYEDCSLSIGGSLSISIYKGYGLRLLRCGAHIVYKKDVESFQQPETRISNYQNFKWKRYGHSFSYSED